jgi:hypothetical protein
MAGADRHHIAHPASADAAAQLTAAVDLITGGESGADPGRVRAFWQPVGHLRSGHSDWLP